MTVIYMLLFIAAFVCFVLAAVGVSVGTRRSINLTALGLAFWVLVPLILSIKHLN